MSIFNKPPNEKPTTERMPTRPEIPATPPVQDGTPSVIAPGMKIVGNVETTGVVKVDGTIEGSIRGARQVLLGRNGVVQGDVHAEEAILAGKVIGTVVATDRVEIQSSSRIDGDIHTRTIVVLEGGVINGNVRMDESATRGVTSLPAMKESRGPLALTQ